MSQLIILIYVLDSPVFGIIVDKLELYVLSIFWALVIPPIFVIHESQIILCISSGSCGMGVV